LGTIARTSTVVPDIEYPFHDRAATVTTCGRICFNRQKINLSQVFAGQTVGINRRADMARQLYGL